MLFSKNPGLSSKCVRSFESSIQDVMVSQTSVCALQMMQTRFSDYRDNHDCRVGRGLSFDKHGPPRNGICHIVSRLISPAIFVSMYAHTFRSNNFHIYVNYTSHCATPRYSTPRYATLYSTPCYTTLLYATLRYATLRQVTQHHATPYNSTLQYPCIRPHPPHPPHPTTPPQHDATHV